MNTNTIMLAMLFGAVGMGYIVYGKRQKKGMALLSGLALCAYPYFVSNILIVIIIGIVLMAVPFFIKY